MLDQSPDEIRIYLDPVKLGDGLDQVKNYLEKRGAKTFIQNVTPGIEDHHEDVVHSVHRALLEAEHKWVAWNDDDDESLGDRRELIEEYADDDVGVIYGDVIAKRGGVIRIRRTKQIHRPRDVNYIIGSGQIYNRDALEETHHVVDHGYWWDFKIFYWMLRAGYRSVYVPKLLSYQNVNLNPSDKRLELHGEERWEDVAERLEKQPFEGVDHRSNLDEIIESGGFPIQECIVCRSTESETVFTKKGASFVRCEGCGLIYVKDRDGRGFEPEKKLSREVFAKEELAPGQMEIGRVLLREILPYVKGGRILDVGCATGYHSAGLAEKGFKVYGVEPNRTSAEWGAEHFPIEMHVGYLDTAPWPEEHFDVIVTKETIEHFHKPNYELNLMRRLLKRGGLLLVKTGASQNNRDFGPEWKYCQPCEFYFFTLNLLTRLIWQNGFNILRTKDLVDGKGEMRVWGKRAV